MGDIKEASQNSSYHKKIGIAIRKGLNRKGVTQKELATIMTVSPALVSGWVRGNKIPTGEDLLRLIEILDLLPLLFSKYVQSSSINEPPLEISDDLSSTMFKELSQIWSTIAEIQKRLAQVENKKE